MHSIRGTLKQEQGDSSHLSGSDTQLGGRAGCRGPMTRSPAEAGSWYGPSVFWDEYGEHMSEQMAATARTAQQTCQA